MADGSETGATKTASTLFGLLATLLFQDGAVIVVKLLSKLPSSQTSTPEIYGAEKSW